VASFCQTYTQQIANPVVKGMTDLFKNILDEKTDSSNIKIVGPNT
jgi:hypothetical protein